MTFVMRALAEIATELLKLPNLGQSCIHFHDVKPTATNGFRMLGYRSQRLAA